MLEQLMHTAVQYIDTAMFGSLKMKTLMKNINTKARM